MKYLSNLFPRQNFRVFAIHFAGPLLLATLLAVAARVCAADKQDPLQPVHRMERRYRSATTLQATFLERYTESGRVIRVESGTAYFRRPGKMRWEYAVPEENLFLIDGKTAWFYVPADHTVTRVPAKQSGDWRTPLALLAGEMKVSRVCDRVLLARDETPENPANVVFTCLVRGSTKASAASHDRQPAPQTGAEDSVLFEIGRDTGELARIVVKDKGGVTVEFKFGGWRENPPVAEALFHFTVPSGVAIVNGELPTASSAASE